MSLINSNDFPGFWKWSSCYKKPVSSLKAISSRYQCVHRRVSSTIQQMKRCTEPAVQQWRQERSDLTAAMNALHQTPQCSRTQTSSSSKLDPEVSVSSIYMQSIFTTGWMIWMLESGAKRMSRGIFFGLFWGGIKFIVGQPPALTSKQTFIDLFELLSLSSLFIQFGSRWTNISMWLLASHSSTPNNAAMTFGWIPAWAFAFFALR